MTASRPDAADFGHMAFGLGIVATGLVAFAWGRFDPGEPVPKTLAARDLLAHVAAVLLIVSGAATTWRRTTAWGSAILTIYLGLVVVLLMNGRVVFSHVREYMAYSSTAEQLALAAAALILFAEQAQIAPGGRERLLALARAAFGICAILFGGAHFIYLDLTAPLVPKWLPPSQLFWAYATGCAHVAAGVAILADVQARLAAILLTVMFALFTPLVHIPALLAAPDAWVNWTENAINVALTGAAWVVADSLRAARSGTSGQCRRQARPAS